MDIMEANKWVFSSTPHKCDAPNENGHYSSCDTGGTCHSNTAEGFDYNVYGPGDNFTINTLDWFHYKIEFNVDGNGNYKSYTSTFSQGDKTFSLSLIHI